MVRNDFVPKEVAEVLEPHEMPHHAELAMGSTPLEHRSDSEWRQNGTNLRCISCQVAHGVYVPPNQIFSGETNAEGMPIIIDRY